MISLRKDLFVNLAISAKALKEKELRAPKIAVTPASFAPKPVVVSKLESSSYDSVAPAVHTPIKKIRLEQTIEDVVKNPKIEALRREIDNAAAIFELVKDETDDQNLINRIERKIIQLRHIIDRKSYVA